MDLGWQSDEIRDARRERPPSALTIVVFCTGKIYVGSMPTTTDAIRKVSRPRKNVCMTIAFGTDEFSVFREKVTA